MKLNNLTRLTKKRKRRGRGGGKGGTSGRGHDGQGVRTGDNIPARFEGGQMPLTRRLPKRGFSNADFRIAYDIVNIGRLNELFNDGDMVTRESLIAKGALKNSSKARIKILGDGELHKKLMVHAHVFSASATQAIKKQGGEVHSL
jgi:large subunit ribosomal protein L15